jgi:hypothetical protein
VAYGQKTIAALFVLFALAISLPKSFGQSGLPDECAQTAQMDIYSDAQVSEVTGDLGDFELALERGQMVPTAKPCSLCTKALRTATASTSL